MLALVLLASTAATQDSIHVQVKLRTPVTNAPVTGTQSVVLRLFDSATAGNAIWGPWTTSVTPDASGVVSMVVGNSSQPLGMSVLQGQTKYLEFQIGGQVLSPRLALFPQGPVGPEGPQGIQGPQGDQGIQGIQGPQGEQGPRGDTGAAGPPWNGGVCGNPATFNAGVTTNGVTTLNGAVTVSGPVTIQGATTATDTISVTSPAGSPALDLRSDSRGINLECGITYPNLGAFAQGIFATVVNGSGGGNAIRAIMETTNGTATGVSIEVIASQSGPARGVYAEVNADSSNAYGLRGDASSDADGYGLYGEASSGINGESYGVYGEANGNGTRYGVYGKTSMSSGYAIYANGNFAATGSKNFIHPHANDPSKEIRFVCLEGNENGCYFRGKAQLVNGAATIAVPAEWSMATCTSSELVTVHLTPIRSFSRLATWGITGDQIEVRGTEDCEFTYLVVGVRRGLASHRPFSDNRAFRPKVARIPFGSEYPKSYRDLLVENGILNADYTPNLQTAARMGWSLREPEADEIQRAFQEEQAWRIRQAAEDER